VSNSGDPYSMHGATPEHPALAYILALAEEAGLL
jgi:hypothetical protein